jgi:hypothetical protein
MLLAFLYSCLRLLLDIADVRLRLGNPEAELLLIRHELRVLQEAAPQVALHSESLRDGPARGGIHIWIFSSDAGTEYQYDDRIGTFSSTGY